MPRTTAEPTAQDLWRSAADTAALAAAAFATLAEPQVPDLSRGTKEAQAVALARITLHEAERAHAAALAAL